MPDKRHTYSYPTRIEYGPGAMRDFSDYLKKSGKQKVLIVTDMGIENAGLADKLRDYFKSDGIDFVTYNKVKSNPVDDNVFEGTRLYKESGCEAIVGLGGGSPLDVGKVIKCMSTHDGPLEKYDDAKGGDKYIQNNMPPFYAIATTAGTGSEVGRSGVITIKSINKKTIIFSPFLMPAIAVLDPEITVSLPPGLTAATGADAFVHNLEAYLMDTFHPLGDAIARQGIYMCYKYLPQAVKNGRDIKARGQMLMASAMGAIAFQKGLGLNHAIAHGLGVYYDIHHGLANAALLVEVMKFNLSDQGVRKKLASLGPLIKAENDAEVVLKKIEEWLVDMGLPTDLKQFNIKEDQLQTLEDYALEDPSCPLNPKKVEKGDVTHILKNLV